ncbi:MAG: hypothetical protein JWN67_4051 [Actinomycetia bacterium]|nr:hypothetical protein [Actinomycetes bacterium]
MRWRALVVLGVLAAGCAGGSDGAAPARDATTTASSAPTSTSTTTTTAVAPVAAMAATTVCPAVPARVGPDPERPRYTLTVDVQPAKGVVTGDVSVRFTPDLPTDHLVFRLWPNGPKLQQAGARLDVGSVSIDGGAPKPGQLPNPTTLVVPLGRTLAAHRSVTARLPWKLRLPGSASDRISRTGDAVRLGSFFPILGWEPGRGWALEPPTTNFAEASTAPTADFAVTITTPPDLQVLASGVPDGKGHWQATAMRDVAVSVGHLRTATAMAGPVRVTVGVDQGVADDPKAYLATAVRVIDDFSARFGPYPWPVYTLSITPNLGGGIEYPSHVMQGPGTGGRTTPHEIGHQWFYALVGDDQGRDPWLDEGLATWAEARFLGNLPTFTSRVVPADAKGRTGLPMTYWEGRSSYYVGVYVQGTQALAALGDPVKVDCALRHYVATNAYRVATPDTLVSAVRAVFPDARAVLARFGAVKP